MQWDTMKKKAITSNVSTSTKWYSAMIFPGDVEGWAEGRRLIGKCFLRAVTAEQGLKEVMGMNWLRGAGRKFRIQRMAPSEDERRNQAIRREGTMGHFASSRKTRWKLTRHPSGEVWRKTIVKAVGSGSLQRTLNANHALWKIQTLKYNFVTGLSFLNLTINFMAAVTICSDLGAQENKVWHCFHCFPIYFPWSDGTRCHDLRFLNVELWAKKQQPETKNQKT